jgi:hypothetical protein
MLTLPSELIVLIGTYLDFQDFCRLKNTCSRMCKSLEQYKVKGASLDIWKKAIEFDKPKIIKSLLHSVLEFVAEEQPFFIHAVEKGNPEIVDLLLQDQRFDPCVVNESNVNALEIALNNCHIQIFQMLLADGCVDPSADDSLVIEIASQIGNLQILQLLLEDHRVDPSSDDSYSLRIASESGHIQIAELLLADDRVDPSAEINEAVRWLQRMVIWKLYSCY